MSRFGDGGRVRCSMGPKLSLKSVFFSLKSPCLRGVERRLVNKSDLKSKSKLVTNRADLDLV